MAEAKKFEDGGKYVEIDLSLCQAAGACVGVCPVGVYEIVDGKVRADKIGDCIECGACNGVCPHNAIVSHWAYG